MSPDRLHQSIARAIARAIAGAAFGAMPYLPACMLLLASLPAQAQRLSTRCYNVPDGLAHSRVSAIHQDRKGYIWFGTWEGLSRFDGYRFTNYGMRDGLGHTIVNDVAEDRLGRLWFATNGGGVSRLIDDPQEAAHLRQAGPASNPRLRFISFRVGDSPLSNRVNVMLFDSADNIWLATDDGVYRAATASSADLQFKLIAPHPTRGSHGTARVDRRGRLWFGVDWRGRLPFGGYALIQIVQDQVIEYGPEDEVGRHEVMSVVEDRQGRLLAANDRGVYEFVEPVDVKSRGRWRRLPLGFGPEQLLQVMLSDSGGALWIGTSSGLIKYRDGKQALYTDVQGLSDNNIRSLMEDRDGNLWIGSYSGGVCKFSGELIVSITRTEGLPGQTVWRVVEDRQGHIYASVLNGGLVEIVEEGVVRVPGTETPPFNVSSPLQDSRGHWWVTTNEGLFRFEGPELQLRRGGKLTQADGIPPDRLNAPWIVTEDPFGKLWVICSGDDFYRLDLRMKERRKARAAFERVPSNTALPGILTVMSDRIGTLWLGWYERLARLREGKISILDPSDGLPETDPRAFFQDSRGWLWIGLRYKGVSMTKDPQSENPKFVNYSTKTGLASDTVWWITEDDAGRIYLSTGKGLDRLDPMTGRVRHFNVRDGLASDSPGQCIKDRKGNIWIATTGGLSKLNPRAERIADRPPPIYFSRAQVAGEDLQLAETGAQSIPELELPSSRNNLFLEYVALSFHGEQRLRYQYKLEGVDKDWSQPAEARSVNYARLAPGAYRFLARAINEEGVMSPEPAEFRFRILPPVWQQWWFLVMAAMLTGAGAYTIYHYRVARLIELERVRMRIATDLHDDIGAGLSRVAILSEVVKQQIGFSANSGEQSIPLLAEIADSARGLVESMREIIWAIDPRRDEMSDVVSRVRRFASDMLEAKGINWDFKVAPGLEKIRLDPERRHHLVLIFKEAITNVARHAGCRNVRLSLTVARGQLRGEIHDDGRGFADQTSPANGQGLENMRQRAAQVGGQIDIESSPGHGARIKLMIPLKK
jgi:ligand-binding sensor domain-containing protein/two-component sensor histidine kinase